MSTPHSIEDMAAMAPPEYVNLNQALKRPNNSRVDVYGSVTQYTEPAQTRGSDVQITLSLMDESVTSPGVPVRFFGRSFAILPKVSQIGDIVFIRRARVWMFEGNRSLVVYNDNVHFVFPKAKIAAPDFRISYASYDNDLPHYRSVHGDAPTKHEQQWAITLHDRLSKTTHALAPSLSSSHSPATSRVPVSSASHQTSVAKPTKFRLVRDLEEKKFCELVVEIVRWFDNSMGDALEVYVTDYTSNKYLRDSGNDDQGYGPQEYSSSGVRLRGKMVLRVDVFAPHAEVLLRQFKPGDHVVLLNVQVKFDPQGYALEGRMWHDIIYPNKIYVYGVKDDEVAANLMERKKSYEAEEIKRSRSKTGGDASCNTEGQDKKRRRNKNKKKVVDQEKLIDVSSDRREELGTSFGKTKRNKNVATNHETKVLSTMQDIVNHDKRWCQAADGLKFESPFVNCKHHALLQVVDFYPHDIGNFVQRSTAAQARNGYMWAFILVLKQGEAQNSDIGLCINVHVFGYEARDLLDWQPDEFEKSLQDNETQTLTQLQHKLFLLWGDLAEIKSSFLAEHPEIPPDQSFSCQKHNIKASNLPFHGVVAEWGLPAPETESIASDDPRIGWDRQYMLTDTRIIA